MRKIKDKPIVYVHCQHWWDVKLTFFGAEYQQCKYCGNKWYPNKNVSTTSDMYLRSDEPIVVIGRVV